MNDQIPLSDSAAAGRSPGRPRQFDHNVVLDSAVRLFWRQGYRDTSTRALESALSISQSSIYNAFGSKQQLLEAALDHYVVGASAALGQPVSDSSEGLAALDSFLVSLGQWLGQADARGCLMINTMLEDGGETPAISQRVHTYLEAVGEALRGALERASTAGEIAASDVDTYTRALISMVLGLNVVARSNAGAAEFESSLQAVRDIVSSWRRSG